MAFLDTTYQKKSFILTAFILSGVLLILFFFGLGYLDPPIENGILIAFGTEAPANNSFELAPEQEAVAATEVPLQEQVAVLESQVQKPLEEVIVAQNAEIVIPQKNKELKEVPKEPIAPPKEPIASPKEASAATKAALANILGAKDAQGAGIGSSQNTSNEGLSDGSLYANSYFGSTQGSLNGIGFGLAGRSLLGKGSVTPDCNEEGRVVVAITVDRSGRVIAADAGVKGTTNNANCLLKPAAATAYMYQWAADPKAPTKQIGFVVINFKLGQ